MTDWFLWPLFALFSLLTAASAAAQVTLSHVTRLRLRHLLQDEAARGQAPLRALEDRAAMLSVGVAVSTLAIAGAAASGLLIAATQWVEAPGRAVAVGVGLLLVLLLLDDVARALARYRPDRAAAFLLGPLRILRVVFWPLVALSMAMDRWLPRLLSRGQVGESPVEDELERLVQAAEENGGLEQEEREMIHSIFRLGERPVREIMVPRIDVVAADRSSTARQVLEKITSTGHSRIPIYDGTIDNVIGVLHAKDLLKYLQDGTLDEPADRLTRTPYFVPETKKIDELLHEMQQRKTHLAIVVDEYGGTAGMITIEDMLEEIVGEIQDEYDVEEARFERVTECEAIFDARMNLHDVGEVLDIDLTEELEEHEFDTLGGLVYERLGKVPVPGDEVRVNGCLISVLSTEGHRIKKVKVTLGVKPEEAGDLAHP